MPLPNKAGEPEFKLKTDPSEKIVFKYKMSQKPNASLSIVNITKERVSYKVKCTDNEIFRVSPPLGFIKPAETATVRITFKPKIGIDPTRHYFAIYHIVCLDESIEDPRTVWTKETKPDGMLRMKAQLEPEEEEEKKEEKKEENKKKDDKKE